MITPKKKLPTEPFANMNSSFCLKTCDGTGVIANWWRHPSEKAASCSIYLCLEIHKKAAHSRLVRCTYAYGVAGTAVSIVCGSVVLTIPEGAVAFEDFEPLELGCVGASRKAVSQQRLNCPCFYRRFVAQPQASRPNVSLVRGHRRISAGGFNGLLGNHRENEQGSAPQRVHRGREGSPPSSLHHR